MRSRGLFLLLTGILAVSGAAWPAGQAGQVPPPPQPPPTGTGFISGQVLDMPSRKPVPSAVVTMTARFAMAAPTMGRGGAITQVLTDAQGRFIFGSLPPGNFTIVGSKTGYTSEGGIEERRSVQIVLADNEKILDARIRLSKTAILSGVLRDAAGDPVVGTDVAIISQSVVNGQTSWLVRGKARSDDRGIYRVGNLPAGDYLACACSRDAIPLDPVLLTTLGSDPLQMMNVAARALSGGGDAISVEGNTRTYAPTFHPNSPTLGRAVKVTLAPGEDKTGVDINLEVVRATRVSGAVVGAAGAVPASALRLIPGGDSGVTPDMFSIPPMLVQPDGRFDFAMVPPGPYRLVAVYRDTGARAGGPSGSALALVSGGRATPVAADAAFPSLRSGGPPTDVTTYWANELLTVPEGGLKGVTVTLNRGVGISGRMMWVGSAPQPPATMLARAGMQIAPLNLQDPITSQLGFPSARISPDGSFALADSLAPGRYYMTPNPLPGFPNLKSVLIGGLDITDMAFDVVDKDIADIVITFVDAPLATVTVTTNAAATSPPFDDAFAFLLPADRKYWPSAAAARRRFRSTTFSLNGIASFDGLPAGEYLVAVGTGADLKDWQDPAHLDALSRKAQRVTIGDGEKRAIEVRR